MFEAEGTEEEIISLYDRLSAHIEEVKMAASDAAASLEKSSHNLPTVEQLVSFILGKSRYEHDIVEIEDHFLMKRITSRDSPNLYRKLALDLQKARKVIEAQKQGAFEQQATTKKNLKKYVFKPLSKSLTEMFGEKPS